MNFHLIFIPCRFLCYD